MRVLKRLIKRILQRLIEKILGRRGIVLFRTRKHYGRDGLFTLHNDHFRHDPVFQAAYARGVRAGHGVDPNFEWRVHVALWVAAQAVRVPGDFVECGVNAGFISSAIMHRLNWRTLDKRFYLLDTFEGPVTSQYSEQEIEQGRLKIAQDRMADGAYVTDKERIHANYAEWPNAVIIQGVVPDVLLTLPAGPIAFLHLDLNCAYPERAALEYFWDRLSPGAFVLLDDYAYSGQDCQTRAIDAAAESLGFEVLSLPTGQGLIMK